ncbi:hypothetical protein [Paenibacillus cremeus]|nr:hypothetical protein [Paenibacillus cremeus]
MKKASAKKPLLSTQNPAIIHNRYHFLMWAKTGNPSHLTKLLETR